MEGDINSFNMMCSIMICYKRLLRYSISHLVSQIALVLLTGSHFTSGCTNLDIGRVRVDCVDEGALVSAAEGIGAGVLYHLQARPEGRERENQIKRVTGIGLKTRLPGGRCQDG